MLRSVKSRFQHFYYSFLKYVDSLVRQVDKKGMASDSSLRIPIIGKCTIEFSDVVEYAPPAYLFPDLPFPTTSGGGDSAKFLPEAVADSVSTSKSRWALTDVNIVDDFSNLDDPVTVDPEFQSAQQALEALVASRDIPFLHDPAQRKYTSEALIQELLNFAKNCNVGEQAAKNVLLAPEFVHFLGYQRLLELNSRFGDKEVVTPAVASRAKTASEKKRKRYGDAQSEKPSSSPWAEDTDSVSAKEDSAEKKSELFSLLTNVVGSSWRAQQSVATQSVMVTAGVNSTSPFADPIKEVGVFEYNRPTMQPVLFCIIKNTTDATGAQRKQIPLSLGENQFGRAAVGSFGAPATSLGAYAAVPDHIAPHHFSLFLAKTEDELQIHLINYSNNGVRVPTRQVWVLANVAQLTVVDEILVGETVSISFSKRDEDGEEDNSLGEKKKRTE